jgi:hypothetical protein
VLILISRREVSPAFAHLLEPIVPHTAKAAPLKAAVENGRNKKNRLERQTLMPVNAIAGQHR